MLFKVLMKSRMNSFTDIYNKVSSGAFLYGYAVVALLLPNIALCYTECLAPWACGANVLLPLALYMWFFSLTRCPGKMIWWAFLFVFSLPSNWYCFISSGRE